MRWVGSANRTKACAHDNLSIYLGLVVKVKRCCAINIAKSMVRMTYVMLRIDIVVVYSLYHARVIVMVVENLHCAMKVVGERDSAI